MKKILIILACIAGAIGIIYGASLDYSVKLYNQSGAQPVTWDWIPNNGTVTGVTIVCLQGTCEYAKVMTGPSLSIGSEYGRLVETNHNNYNGWTRVYRAADDPDKTTSTWAYVYQAITVPGAGTSKGTVSTGFYLRAVSSSTNAVTVGNYPIGSVVQSNRNVKVILWY